MQKVEVVCGDGSVASAACVFNQDLVMIMSAVARAYNKKDKEDLKTVRNGMSEVKTLIKISGADIEEDCDMAFEYMKQRAEDIGAEVVVFDGEKGFSPLRELLIIDNKPAICFLDIVAEADAEYKDDEYFITIDIDNQQTEALHCWFSNNVKEINTDKIEKSFEVLKIAQDYENMSGEPYYTLESNNAEVYSVLYNIFRSADHTQEL
ncbi:MAG: hypothetical protein LBN07_01415 [Christensenellaceae bacterium]|jgi:hypothetical protein|nr:hypothetical protein [Christensenellaceae bacterium]